MPVDPMILQVLPHRAPILRVHRFVTAAGDAAVVAGAEAGAAGDLPWDVGAIEGMAQAAALLLAHRASDPPQPIRGMLVAVPRFAIHARPEPGAEIEYHVRLVRRFGAMSMIEGRAVAGGQDLAAGQLTVWTAPTADA